MGMQQIREAFNRALGDAGSCIKGFMDYSRVDGKQVQIITLIGSWADGEEFTAQTPTHDMSSDGQTEVRALGLQMRDQVRKKEPATTTEGAVLAAATGPSASNLETKPGSASVPEPSPVLEHRLPAGGTSKAGDKLANPFMGL
ncbi:MAG TPA: hypothetical protein VK577_03125 [Bradyrhizobium sp.]|nr:hypothetical protein [Bradyrhizobium sp.]